MSGSSDNFQSNRRYHKMFSLLMNNPFFLPFETITASSPTKDNADVEGSTKEDRCLEQVKLEQEKDGSEESNGSEVVSSSQEHSDHDDIIASSLPSDDGDHSNQQKDEPNEEKLSSQSPCNKMSTPSPSSSLYASSCPQLQSSNVTLGSYYSTGSSEVSYYYTSNSLSSKEYTAWVKKEIIKEESSMNMKNASWSQNDLEYYGGVRSSSGSSSSSARGTSSGSALGMSSSSARGTSSSSARGMSSSSLGLSRSTTGYSSLDGQLRRATGLERRTLKKQIEMSRKKKHHGLKCHDRPRNNV